MWSNEALRSTDNEHAMQMNTRFAFLFEKADPEPEVVFRELLSGKTGCSTKELVDHIEWMRRRWKALQRFVENGYESI